MKLARAVALVAGIALGVSLCASAVSAQTESATAEDGIPASEAPAETAAAPNVPLGANLTPPLGANLTPPLGALPPGPAIVTGPGSGQPGTSTVTMAPGSHTSGVAREGAGAVRAPEAAPPAAPAVAPAGACTDFPTWYDAQLALESSVDEVVIAALDPDGDGIACEEVMYP